MRLSSPLCSPPAAPFGDSGGVDPLAEEEVQQEESPRVLSDDKDGKAAKIFEHFKSVLGDMFRVAPRANSGSSLAQIASGTRQYSCIFEEDGWKRVTAKMIEEQWALVFPKHAQQGPKVVKKTIWFLQKLNEGNRTEEEAVQLATKYRGTINQWTSLRDGMDLEMDDRENARDVLNEVKSAENPWRSQTNGMYDLNARNGFNGNSSFERMRDLNAPNGMHDLNARNGFNGNSSFERMRHLNAPNGMHDLNARNGFNGNSNYNCNRFNGGGFSLQFFSPSD
jgi:hypothetical protein